jgi:hypothetical protein
LALFAFWTSWDVEHIVNGWEVRLCRAIPVLGEEKRMKTCCPGVQFMIVGILIWRRPQGRRVRVAVWRPLIRCVRMREVRRENM